MFTPFALTRPTFASRLILIAFALTMLAAIAFAGAHVAFAVPAFGAVTLAQAATLSQTDLQAGVVETFIIESSVMDRILFKPIEGNAYAYNAEATLPGVEFRAVNAAYAESTGTVVQASESLVILGGDADVDTFIQRTRSNKNDQKATQTALKVKAAVYKFQDTFFNGDIAVDANAFDGLKKRLVGAQIIDAGANGLPIVGATSNDRHAFLDVLDQAIAAVPGATPDNSAFYANDLVKARLMSSARRESLATTTVDDFGKTTDRYRGYAILDAGNRGDGTRILPQTEVQGTSGATASSIYFVRFGADETDRAVTGLYNGPPSVFDVRDLGEQHAKPAERVRIEGFLGVALFGGRAASRIRGALNA